jgi:hypothetical protein
VRLLVVVVVVVQESLIITCEDSVVENISYVPLSQSKPSFTGPFYSKSHFFQREHLGFGESGSICMHDTGVPVKVPKAVPVTI